MTTGNTDNGVENLMYARILLSLGVFSTHQTQHKQNEKKWQLNWKWLIKTFC